MDDEQRKNVKGENFQYLKKPNYWKYVDKENNIDVAAIARTYKGRVNVAKGMTCSLKSLKQWKDQLDKNKDQTIEQIKLLQSCRCLPKKCTK